MTTCTFLANPVTSSARPLMVKGNWWFQPGMGRPVNTQTSEGFACLENVRLLNIIDAILSVEFFDIAAAFPPPSPMALTPLFTMFLSPLDVMGFCFLPTHWTSVAFVKGMGAPALMSPEATGRAMRILVSLQLTCLCLLLCEVIPSLGARHSPEQLFFILFIYFRNVHPTFLQPNVTQGG